MSDPTPAAEMPEELFQQYIMGTTVRPPMCEFCGKFFRCRHEPEDTPCPKDSRGHALSMNEWERLKRISRNVRCNCE